MLPNKDRCRALIFLAGISSVRLRRLTFSESKIELSLASKQKLSLHPVDIGEVPRLTPGMSSTSALCPVRVRTKASSSREDERNSVAGW